MGIPMRTLGIDPGQDVALCLLPGEGPDSRITRLIRSPGKGVDEAALRAAIVEMRPDVAVVERVGVMPGQGATSGATFMVAWGIIRGCLLGLGVPYTMVAPIAWKNRLLDGFDMGPAIPKKATPPEGLRGRDLALWAIEEGTRLRKAKEARKNAQKAAAVAFVHDLCPGIDLIPPGCRIENHNLAEAVCLARYGEVSVLDAIAAAEAKAAKAAAKARKGRRDV